MTNCRNCKHIIIKHKESDTKITWYHRYYGRSYPEDHIHCLKRNCHCVDPEPPIALERKGLDE